MISELGSSSSDVWSEGTRSVTDAVAHSAGNDVAHVASSAMAAGGSVGGLAWGVTPAAVARKAALAGALGVAGVDAVAVGTADVEGSARADDDEGEIESRIVEVNECDEEDSK